MINCRFAAAEVTITEVASFELSGSTAPATFALSPTHPRPTHNLIGARRLRHADKASARERVGKGTHVAELAAGDERLPVRIPWLSSAE